MAAGFLAVLGYLLGVRRALERLESLVGVLRLESNRDSHNNSSSSSSSSSSSNSSSSRRRRRTYVVVMIILVLINMSAIIKTLVRAIVIMIQFMRNSNDDSDNDSMNYSTSNRKCFTARGF